MTTTYDPTHICANCEKEWSEHLVGTGDGVCYTNNPRCFAEYEKRRQYFTPSNRLTFSADKALAGWGVVTRDGKTPTEISITETWTSGKVNSCKGYWETKGGKSTFSTNLDLFLVADYKPEEKELYVITSHTANLTENLSDPICQREGCGKRFGLHYWKSATSDWSNEWRNWKRAYCDEAYTLPFLPAPEPQPRKEGDAICASTSSLTEPSNAEQKSNPSATAEDEDAGTVSWEMYRDRVESETRLQNENDSLTLQLSALQADKGRLEGLFNLTKPEGENGKFMVTLEYDNYQDVAIVRNADGKIIGEGLFNNDSFNSDLDMEVDQQFRTAIDAAMKGQDENRNT